jgi:ferredoxin-NADP reductase
MDLLARRTTWESDGVLSVELADPAGAALPSWEPGAHVSLLAGAVERQYSLCGDPTDRARYRIAVLREPLSRGGSAWVHMKLRPGNLVTVTPPRNNFPLIAADEYLFIAGGIGITPLLPMIAAAEAAGARWRLVYGGRRRPAMAFTGELDRYGARVALWPQDSHGMIRLDDELDGMPGADVYCCGPEPLLAAVEKRCQGTRTLRVERFSPKVLSYDELAARGPDAAFEVALKRSGGTFTVEPGTTILATLEANGVVPASSCQEGTCGTCETTVLEGVPEHRDSILDEEDRKSGETMMICVSRSKSPRLVLDL